MGSSPPEPGKPAIRTAGKKDGGQVLVKGEGVLELLQMDMEVKFCLEEIGIF